VLWQNFAWKTWAQAKEVIPKTDTNMKIIIPVLVAAALVITPAKADGEGALLGAIIGGTLGGVATEEAGGVIAGAIAGGILGSLAEENNRGHREDHHRYDHHRYDHHYYSSPPPPPTRWNNHRWAPRAYRCEWRYDWYVDHEVRICYYN
jgi:hypothetical protein